jgi:lipopolysaccharide transport system ATP-binding protein
MSEIAIQANGIGKRYKIGAARRGYRSLREEISGWLRPGQRRKAVGDSTFWALKDVSFAVHQGEVVGVIGRNGAGKSTLLKIMAGITEPTEGEGIIRGRVGSLLEVGTGFHPELTGRENIYLNGAIIGMKQVEIARKFDEIVDFAEVEKFIDTPVKHYSSGMYVRLAFSVAAHLEPEILLVDEVLAVGDAAFQKKCLGKMGEVTQTGRTVFFVSHNMASVKQLCTRGILLGGGQVVYDGSIDEAVDRYIATASDETIAETTFTEHPDTPINILRLTLLNAAGEKTAYFTNDEAFTLEIEYQVRATRRDDHWFVLLERADGLLVIKASDDDGGIVLPETRQPGQYITRVRFPGSVLNEGYYRFRAIIGKRRGVKHDDRASGYFEIEDTSDYSNSAMGKRNGTLLLPLGWEEQTRETASAES